MAAWGISGMKRGLILLAFLGSALGLAATPTQGPHMGLGLAAADAGLDLRGIGPLDGCRLSSLPADLEGLRGDALTAALAARRGDPSRWLAATPELRQVEMLREWRIESDGGSARILGYAGVAFDDRRPVAGFLVEAADADGFRMMRCESALDAFAAAAPRFVESARRFAGL